MLNLLQLGLSGYDEKTLFLYPPRSTVLFAILNRLSTGQITLYCL